MATKKHKKYIEVAGAALTGEILIFLPGMKEIEEVETQL
jgi:HrpA-like RNA helicase